MIKVQICWPGIGGVLYWRVSMVIYTVTMLFLIFLAFSLLLFNFFDFFF
jgi:hypothetical protein